MKSLNQWKIFENRKDKEFERIAYLSNPKSIMDNVAKVTRVFLVGATGYILLTGAIYHYETFQTAIGGSIIPVLIAFTVFCGIEAAKVIFGRQFIRGIATGDMGESKVHFIAYSMLGVLSCLSIWLSYDISTNKTPTLNKLINISSGKTKSDTTELVNIAASIAAIDAQIGTVNATEKEGFNNRYRGVVTENGQLIAKKAGQTRDKLTSQRIDLVTQLNAEKARVRAFNETQYSAAALQLQQYGGIAEILQGFLIILLSLCEVISYMKTKKQIENGEIKDPEKEDEKKPQTGGIQDFTKKGTINTQPASNQRIGFRYGERQNTPTPTPPPPITPTSSAPSPTNGVSMPRPVCATAYVSNEHIATYGDWFEVVLVVENRPIFSATFQHNEKGFYVPMIDQYGKELCKIGFLDNQGVQLISDGNEAKHIDCIKSIMARMNYPLVISKMTDLLIIDIISPPPTPSVSEPNNNESIQTGVAHPASGVAHQTEVKEVTDPNSRLELLRLEIQKYSQSHYEGSKADNVTVSKKTFGFIDEALDLLQSGQNFKPQNVAKFLSTANNRVELAKRYGFEYGRSTELEYISLQLIDAAIDRNKEVNND